MERLYSGIDLHSNNCHVVVINQDDKRVYHKKLLNAPEIILPELARFKERLQGVVIESTFNWYWLVDALMDDGYKTHLANPAGIQKYRGLKNVGDKHDAFWLAHLLRLNILPEGYIYPKEERPVRDLLRKRMHFVQLRTSMINSLQGIISRNTGRMMNANQIKPLKQKNYIVELLKDYEELAFCGEISKEAIDHLSMQIQKIESTVLNKIKIKKEFMGLQTIPGIGKTLSLTIMLETGDISRFKKVGDFSSYCRKVPANWTSNDKKKGSGNKKNGNKYLAWAFSEAAELARRFDRDVKAFYNRKLSKTNRMIAHAALAHKLARAAYFIMRDNVAFDHEKLFA